MAPWLESCYVTCGLCCIVMAWWWWRRGGLGDRSPARWQQVGVVSQLLVYPLKSGKARLLQRAHCAALGLVDIQNPDLHLHDREFIVYNDIKKTAISGLVCPKMVLMEISTVDGSTLKLSYPGEEDFFLNVPFDSSKVVILNRWWGETVGAVDCGEEVAEWLTGCLRNEKLQPRLGHFTQSIVPPRTIHKGWKRFARVYHRLRSEYLGAYSYMASYHIVTDQSMADINSQLDSQRNAIHYRANIVVKVNTSQPFSEDSWDWLRFGTSAVLRGFKPCTRCAVTAIDVDTGKLDPNLEPLRSLKMYRQLTRLEERELSGSEPVFGLYAGLDTPGPIAVGDPVYIGVS